MIFLSSPAAPHGGRTGGKEKLQQLSAPTSSLALLTIRIFFPPVPQRERGCRNLTSQSTHGSYGVQREAQRGSHPLTTIGYRSMFQRDVFKENNCVHEMCTTIRFFFSECTVSHHHCAPFGLAVGPILSGLTHGSAHGNHRSVSRSSARKMLIQDRSC